MRPEAVAKPTFNQLSPVSSEVGFESFDRPRTVKNCIYTVI